MYDVSTAKKYPSCILLHCQLNTHHTCDNPANRNMSTVPQWYCKYMTFDHTLEFDYNVIIYHISLFFQISLHGGTKSFVLSKWANGFFLPQWGT